MTDPTRSDAPIAVSIVTAFPELFRSYISTSIIGRGVESGRLDVEILDIRDFAEGGYRQIDDYSFGGGGMVIMPEPLRKAVDSIAGRDERYVVYPSPQGVPLYQQQVEDLYRVARTKRLVIVCGHYEGIDERFTENYVDLEVSLGDFVLTGGELPALAILDSISRLVSGVVGRERAVTEDSFYSGMLDHPHYTRPYDWDGVEAPEVLIGGDHAAIEAFRRDEAVARTLARRPDIIARAGIMPYMKRGVYVMQLHHPVLDRNGEKSTTAITGMDIHDIARACRTYGVKKYIIVTPLAPQREMIAKIAAHWTEGYGASFNPDRSEAMSLIKTFGSYGRALAWVADREKAEPFKVATTARISETAENWQVLKGRLLQIERPAVFVFGTGHGLHDEVISGADSVLAPIMGGTDGYNHLSVRSAASIVLDRFFGFR